MIELTTQVAAGWTAATIFGLASGALLTKISYDFPVRREDILEKVGFAFGIVQVFLSIGSAVTLLGTLLQ
jgi:hypothetical protein